MWVSESCDRRAARGWGGHTWSVSAPIPACYSSCWLPVGASLSTRIRTSRSQLSTSAGAHGKAEARYILEGGEVYLCPKQGVAGDDLKSLVISQDVDTLLSMLHRVEVHPSDVVYVPPGVLHAINECVPGRTARAGAPSILLEWRDFDLEGVRDGHLGLDFNLTLEAVECRSRSGEERRRLIRSAGFGSSGLPDAADPLLPARACRAERPTTLDPGFAVLVMPIGEADLEGGRALHLRGGNTTHDHLY
jgi:hypothetical protein